MAELALSQNAQHWVNVVLIWVGFGALAGALAQLILPFRQPTGPVLTLLMGCMGSALGLLVLSLAVANLPANPISPLGFAAATAGSFVLLILYRLARACTPEKKVEQGDANEAGKVGGRQ
jgi:uncharacterized membrane protein YeaQ/YmgE (transglycosylase-associated protein family)